MKPKKPLQKIRGRHSLYAYTKDPDDAKKCGHGN
jgi:hypothetical protein